MFKFVLTVPVTTVDADFPLMLTKVIGVIIGTMCSKFVLTVPLTTVDEDLPLTLKNVIGVIRVTMYTNMY